MLILLREIEHSQNYGGKEEGTGVEDEEALFSAVQGSSKILLLSSVMIINRYGWLCYWNQATTTTEY